MLPVKKRRYITGIDGIRAIAVISVILYHLLPDVLPGGYLGVSLFFVISGYLMTDILLSQWHDRGKISLSNFYRKRIKRIYPSLLIVLFSFGTIALFLKGNYLLNYKQITLTSLLNVNNWWQIINGSSYFDRFANQSAFTHLWSLSIEGQFYIIWPIVLAFLMYKKESHKLLWTVLITGTVISAVLMGLFYNPESINRIYYGTDTRLFSILMGGILAVCLRDFSEKLVTISSKWGIIASVLSSVLIILSFIFMKDTSPLTYKGGMVLFSLISTCLLFTVIQFQVVNQGLTNPVFKWIGLRSYEIYLWQFPVMIVYENIFKLDGTNRWIHFGVQIIIILLLSEVTYRLSKFLVADVKWNKTFLQFNLNDFKQNSIISFLGILVIGFLCAFILAPSGRDANSLALQKKLAQNQKLVAEKNAQKQKSTAASQTIGSTVEKKEQKTAEQSTDALTNSIVLSEADRKRAAEMKITAVGDSVLLSAAPSFQEIFKNSQVDAKIGRQLIDSKDIFARLSKDKQLGDIIVVALGTNGSFSEKDINEVMSYAGDRSVYFVNTMVERSWQKAVNDELDKTSKRYKNAYVVDWKSYSTGHRDWFDVDDVHLVDKGAQEYSTLIARKVLDTNS